MKLQALGGRRSLAKILINRQKVKLHNRLIIDEQRSIGYFGRVSINVLLETGRLKQNGTLNYCCRIIRV